MITIIRWTLWQRRWSLMWWAIGMVGMIALELGFYPSFRDQAGQLNQVFDQIPAAARSFISDSSDFFSPTGYLASRVFALVLPILFTIFAISLGSSLLGRDERDGTIELLLSRPLSRSKLLAGRALTGLMMLTLLALLGLAAVISLDALVNLHVAPGPVAAAVAMSALLGLSFGTIALLITCMGGPARVASVGIATFLAFAGYILASLESTVHWLVWPARLLPFHYYHPSELLHNAYHWQGPVFMGGVVVIGYLLAWAAFRRRDIGA